MNSTERDREDLRSFCLKNPWYVSLRKARERCRNKKEHNYPHYGGRGILCLLTVQDMRTLWDRDGGKNLKKPTIDRINPDGHYELSNCQFIEQAINSGRRRNPGGKP